MKDEPKFFRMSLKLKCILFKCNITHVSCIHYTYNEFIDYVWIDMGMPTFACNSRNKISKNRKNSKNIQ